MVSGWQVPQGKAALCAGSPAESAGRPEALHRASDSLVHPTGGSSCPSARQSGPPGRRLVSPPAALPPVAKPVRSLRKALPWRPPVPHAASASGSKATRPKQWLQMVTPPVRVTTSAKGWGHACCFSVGSTLHGAGVGCFRLNHRAGRRCLRRRGVDGFGPGFWCQLVFVFHPNSDLPLRLFFFSFLFF